MNNKSAIIIVIVVLVLVALGLWWWMSQSMSGLNNPYNLNQGQTNGGQQNAAKGTVYFAVKDAAVNMNSVTAVDMTVDNVYIHSQTQGWVTVSQVPQTFSLLDLKAKAQAALLAKADVAADTYDQIWLHVSKVMVTESGKAAVQATMPSSDFTMNAVVKVAADASGSAVVDVLADQSMHKTAKGEFVFTPVVKFESRSNATVSVGTNNAVVTSGGTVDTNATAGMDLDGQVKSDFKVDLNAPLGISGGVITVIQ